MFSLYGENFISDVRDALRAGLSLECFSLPGEGCCELPIIELGFPDCAIEKSLYITGDSGEKALIERSINAIRGDLYCCLG